MAQRRKSKTSKKGQSGRVTTNTRRPLLTYIKGIQASLNPTDRRIAEHIFSDPEKVITSSITELNEECRASVGAIVGFARRVGLKGFADFKIALAQDLAQSGLSAGDIQENGTVFEKVFHFHMQSLEDTLRINTEAAFKKVAETLDKARRIELFSTGMSYPVAYTASSKFLLIGLPSSTQFDSHMQLFNASQLRASDVAFGVSCSGTTRETVQCMEVAKGNGAQTICLTNAMKSPIIECSDLSLYATPSEVKYFQAPLAARISQMAVIDALFVYLAQKHKKSTARRLQSAGEELVKHRLT